MQVVGSSILFRGLRVRMSIATGGVESVRLHSVTQRAEYVGEVLRKVQAVGETPQGGQVSSNHVNIPVNNMYRLSTP